MSTLVYIHAPSPLTFTTPEEPQMSRSGRVEPRVSFSMPVCLVSTTEPDAAELVYTENVSSGGVRAVSRRRWKLGQHHRIIPVSMSFDIKAQVVYCQPLPNRSFSVGLKLYGAYYGWWRKR